MPTATYIPLATITLTSAASTVTFGSIPNTYKDLVMIIAGTGSVSTNIGWRPNNDGNNHAAVYASGNGSSPASGTLFAGQVGFLYNTQSVVVLQAFDYAATDKQKTILSRASSANGEVQMLAGRWASTSAISSIVMTGFGNNFASGTTLSLYGIAG